MTGSITQRSRGSYQIAIYLGIIDGKQQYVRKTVRGTKREAQAELVALLHSLNRGEVVKPSKLTTAEYLEQWKQNYARDSVAPKTLERYDELIRLNIVPAIGKIMLEKLQPLHIQACYTAMLRSGRKDGKGGLSPQTVLHVHRLLREALQQAVRWQIITRNPCDAVEPPKPTRTEMRTLSEPESAWLLEIAHETRLYAAVLLGIATGLRRGEILALRWRDLNLDTGSLTVTQSLECTRDGMRFKQPKTKRSRRSLPLPAFAIAGLKEHRLRQISEKEKWCGDYDDQDIVCARPDGAPIDPDAFTSAFIKLARRAGFKNISFHSLRHSHASQLLKANVHPKVVSERLGHSCIAITLDLYSHVVPGLQEEAVGKLDLMISAAIEKQKNQPRN